MTSWLTHVCTPRGCTLPLQVEIIDFTDANKGFEKIHSGAPRYRMVMKIEGARAELAAKGL